MGIKHSVNLQTEAQKNRAERIIPVMRMDDRNNISSNYYQENGIQYELNNHQQQYHTLNRRQSTVYNFNCLPPKPPRHNTDILMTGEAVSNRIAPPSFPNEHNRNSPTYLKSNDTSRSLTPLKPNLLQELLECPICMNLYDNPHVLPCQHTFCKKCLVSLQNNDTNKRTNSIDCPICREKHILLNGIDSLAANYTMKRLIELEQIAAMDREKNKEKSKAKCYGCQRYAHLKVCVDCSYMLCVECIENPDHDYIIESKINSVKHLAAFNSKGNYSSRNKYHQSYNYGKFDTYMMPKENDKLKITLLCHSSAVEAVVSSMQDENIEVIDDEYGKCKTFCKVGLSTNDRVITLKKIVEKKFGILTKDQILVYKERILKSDLKPLSHYRLRQFSRIHVFDERDVKENQSVLEEEDLYGIYQDTNSIQINGLNKKEKNMNREENKNDSKKELLIKNSSHDNIESSSSSSQTDSSFERKYYDSSKHIYDYNKNESVKRINKKRASSAFNSNKNYYAEHKDKYATMSRYRRLDEIFDHNLNLNDY